MAAIRVSSFSSLPRAYFHKPTSDISFHSLPISFLSPNARNKLKLKLFSTVSSTVTTQKRDPFEQETQVLSHGDKFNWFSHWYPIMPVCDLDKRVPHAKRVLGLDVVVWWDKNENAWKVFDDMCPHRLAPLSEGRIDQWGRLQCVYHGWCFSGSGDCKFIPQAPPDGPPVNTFKRACVAVYPSTTQNGIVWFWPNTDPQYQNILMTKKPPFIPELDDPAYTSVLASRDIPYGYEVLLDNLMDPAHLPYAHYGLLEMWGTKNSRKADREGGVPRKFSIEALDINGYVGKQENGSSKFIAPCVFYAPQNFTMDLDHGYVPSVNTEEEKSSSRAPPRMVIVVFCVPVSPGKSRLIWSFPRNFARWVDRIVPKWIYHIVENLVIDSDLYLLHLEERKIMEAGPINFQNACFTPTKADALVVGFRKWLIKYSGGQVDWGTKFNGLVLPPSPPREQLMDRYWSHVVKCSSCNGAMKGLKALEIILQITCVASIGLVAAIKQNAVSVSARTWLVFMAVLCFVASKWFSFYL